MGQFVTSRKVYERVLHAPPRTLQIMERDSQGQVPIGRRKLSAQQAAERVRPLVEAAARGEIPLDQQTADAFRLVVEHEHKRMRQGMKS